MQIARFSSSRARTRRRGSWQSSLGGLVLLLLTSTLGGCTLSKGSSTESGEAAAPEERLTGEALCAEAFQGQNQRPAAEFTPGGPSDAEPEVDSLLGIGTTPDGFCLDTGTEFYGSPWEITAITVTASPVDDEVWGSTYTRTTVLDNEHLPFFVPAETCTVVSGVMELTHPRTGETRTWTAEGVFHPLRRKACDEASPTARAG